MQARDEGAGKFTIWMTLAALSSCALALPQRWHPVALSPAAPPSGTANATSYTQRVVDSIFNRRKSQPDHPPPAKDYPMELNLMSDFLSNSIPDLKQPSSSNGASSNNMHSLDKLILAHTKNKRPILKQSATGTVGFIKQPVNVEDVRWEHVGSDQLVTADPTPPFPSAPSYSSFDHHRPSHRPHHDSFSGHHKPQFDSHRPSSGHKPVHDTFSQTSRPPYYPDKPNYGAHKPSHDSSFSQKPSYAPHRPSHNYHKPVPATEYTPLVHKPIATIQQIHHQTSTSFPQIIIVNHHYPLLSTSKPTTATEYPPADFATQIPTTTEEPTTTTTERTTTERTTTTKRSTTTKRPTTTRQPTTTTTVPTTPYEHEILKCPEITINTLINNYNYNNSSKQAVCSDLNLVINNQNYGSSTTEAATVSTPMSDPTGIIQGDPQYEEPEYPDDTDVPPTLAATMTPIMNFMNGLNPLSYGFWSILLAPFALVVGLLTLLTHHSLWKRSYKPVVNNYYKVKHEHPKEYATVHYTAANEFKGDEYSHHPGYRRSRRDDGLDLGGMLREEMDYLNDEVWKAVEKYLGWDESD